MFCIVFQEVNNIITHDALHVSDSYHAIFDDDGQYFLRNLLRGSDTHWMMTDTQRDLNWPRLS